MQRMAQTKVYNLKALETQVVDLSTVVSCAEPSIFIKAHLVPLQPAESQSRTQVLCRFKGKLGPERTGSGSEEE